MCLRICIANPLSIRVDELNAVVNEFCEWIIKCNTIIERDERCITDRVDFSIE